MRLSEFPLVSGRFEKRNNRFVCTVELENGQTIRAHVPNTGRMKELLITGAEVRLAYAPAPKRKTDYTLLAVLYRGTWVCVYAAYANQLAYEYLSADPSITDLKREVVYEDSRFDLAGRKDGISCYYEVKSVNLVLEHSDFRAACFPDAPTQRGAKHLRGLLRAHRNGAVCGVVFVIMRNDADFVIPNWKTDPEFSALLDECESSGLDIRAVKCRVNEERIDLDRPIPVKIKNSRDIFQ